MKIIYAGTPEFALPALRSLLASEHEVVAVYTQPDRPAGRGRKLQQSPVKSCALEHALPVIQPVSFKQAADRGQLAALQADLMVVAAYGLILPAEILQAPRLGCINIHASLLPRWRGAAPIQRAILAGDAQTGITIMQMNAGLDTGEMLKSVALAIDPQWGAAELHDALMVLGAELLMQTLALPDLGRSAAQPQDDTQASYAARLTKAEAEIDWHKSVVILQREILAYRPWPVSFTYLEAEPLRIWCANIDTRRKVDNCEPGAVLAHDNDGIYVACSDGALQITELQFAGKKRSSAAQVLNAKNLTGHRFGK